MPFFLERYIFLLAFLNHYLHHHFVRALKILMHLLLYLQYYYLLTLSIQVNHTAVHENHVVFPVNRTVVHLNNLILMFCLVSENDLPSGLGTKKTCWFNTKNRISVPFLLLEKIVWLYGTKTQTIIFRWLPFRWKIAITFVLEGLFSGNFHSLLGLDYGITYFYDL